MKLDDLKKLHQKKYRSQFSRYLVEGEHLINELKKALALKTISSEQGIHLYVSESRKEDSLVKELQSSFSLPLTVVGEQKMMQLSDTKSPQGIIASVPMPNNDGVQVRNALKNEEKQKYIYLYEVQDPGNLGTIIRTLAWFGGFKLLLSPNSVDPFNAKVVRSSMGAIFHLAIEQEVCLSHLQERFDSFAYLDMNGKAIADNSFSDHPCYLFGNEARGVPHKELEMLNAKAYTIKGQGVIDSLNLASAVNMCTYRLSE